MKTINIKPIKHPEKMINYWKNQWIVVLLIVVSGIAYNGTLALGPVIQGKIIDLIIGNQGKEIIIQWIGIFLGVIGMIQIMRYLKRYYVRVFANRTSATMRTMVYNNIVNKDLSELKDQSTGDLMTKAISDVNACAEGMRKFTTEIFDTGVLMVSYFVIMLFYDVKVTIISTIFIPVAMIIAERLKTIIFKYSKEYRNKLSQVSEITLENVENELLYRINSVEEIKIEKYKEHLDDLEKKAVLANMLENSMQPIYKTISLIGIVAIVFYSGNMVLNGQWTVGAFSAYIAIFTSFAVKVSKAAKLFNSVQKAEVSWLRIKPYLSEYREEKDRKFVAEGTTELIVKNMAFRKVSNISFSVKTGQLVGITGPVAGGKSTIGIALQGLYPYEGSIMINGRELSDYQLYEVSKLVTYMGHSSELLSDTIYNNITLGDQGDISQVLKDVCFDEDLTAMEKGVDTMVGASGIRLSGGQQARLSLARALYNKSKILVLDDPFAAVDIKTEEKIIENLKKNYGDCAIVLISHRTSCFSNADKVLTVADGRAKEDE
ncbi:MAG: ABC transporter ATP-binding protein [Anaerovoracaceae bacterium]